LSQRLQRPRRPTRRAPEPPAAIALSPRTAGSLYSSKASVNCFTHGSQIDVTSHAGIVHPAVPALSYLLGIKRPPRVATNGTPSHRLCGDSGGRGSVAVESTNPTSLRSYLERSGLVRVRLVLSSPKRQRQVL